jgi:hypothetical protein
VNSPELRRNQSFRWSRGEVWSPNGELNSGPTHCECDPSGSIIGETPTIRYVSGGFLSILSSGSDPIDRSFLVRFLVFDPDISGRSTRPISPGLLCLVGWRDEAGN